MSFKEYVGLVAQDIKKIHEYIKRSAPITSISELRTYAGNSQYVHVAGYYNNTPGKGGGLFVSVPTDTTSTDNHGTIIVSSNGTRWYRVFSDKLSLVDFGYESSKNNAAEAVNRADATNLGVLVDCLGLTIDMGTKYPIGNRYTNGRFTISGKTVDTQYRLPRTGIGRFVSGSRAATKITNGEWNGFDLVVIGEGAMENMERCVSGIAIGNRAQGNSKKSRDNIAIGSDSLINVQAETEWYDQSKMGGTRNIGIGGNAGRGITSGAANVAIGRNAGQGLSTGNSNVVIGAAAIAGVAPVGLGGDIEMFWTTPTSLTVAIGQAALQYYRGTGAQTVIGSNAGKYAKTADKVTVLGINALENLESNRAPSGGDIIWSGTETGTYTQTGNTIVLTMPNIRSAAVNYWIGIRLTSGEAQTLQGDIVPVRVVSIDGNKITVNSPKSLNTSGNAELRYVHSDTSSKAKNEELTIIGANALNKAVDSAYTTVVGADAMVSVTNAQKSVSLGASSFRNGTHTSSVAIGYWCAPTYSTHQCIFIGDSAGYRNIQGDVASGRVVNSIAIGVGARLGGNNEIQLGVTGQTLYAPTSVNIRSDVRDKADIEPLKLGLDFVNKLKPVTGVYDRRDNYTDELFNDVSPEERKEKLAEWWKNPVKDGRHKESRPQHWFIAQDVKALEEEFGELPMINFRQDTYTLEYEMFIPSLVKAIQELTGQVEQLKKEVKELKDGKMRD